jgi:ABC-type nitrate/sulfonate/bicarbonate transport system permease component
MIEKRELTRSAEAAAPAAETPTPGGRGSWVERGISLVSPLVLLLIWEVLVRTRVLDLRFFPAPSQVLRALYELLTTGVLLEDVRVSLVRIAAGFTIGAGAGLVAGLLMGISRLIRAAGKPLFGVLYPIPKIAILPLVMLVFGIGETSKYVIVAIGVFFLVLLNTMAGVMNIDRIYLDVGRNYGARRLDVLRRIALPGALPFIFTGIRLGWGTGLLLIVAAEFISSKSGLGYLIWNAWQTFSVDEMYAGLLTISALGLLSFAVLDVLERWLIPWKAEPH